MACADILEREDQLGGNWNYNKPCARVYRSTRMISSKSFTQFPDFPFPSHYPDYPHHAQVLEYLQAYAAHFGIDRQIEFSTSVERISPESTSASASPAPHWRVTLASGQTRRYGGVVVANGHNWSPKFPKYEGEFSGQVMHSADYRTPDALAAKRVLVVGGGNSGCDIACEAAQHAAATFHSTRRGYWYIPKYLFGRPSDRMVDKLLKAGVPLSMRRGIIRTALRLAVGSPQRFGLPKPDHKLFETHPIVNTLLLYYVQHGAIAPKPEILRLDGKTVHFTDGTAQEVDLIVYATGYNIVFPFIDTALLNWQDGRPRLAYNVFHPAFDNLFVIGLIQPDSGQFGLVHWQSKAVATYVQGLREEWASVDKFRRTKSQLNINLDGGIHYKDSTRHYLEVEHWSYRKALRRLVDELSKDARARPNIDQVRNPVAAPGV